MTPPPAWASVGLTVGVAISLAPSLLPRGPVTQGVLTGVLAALAVGISGALVRMGRRRAPSGAADTSRRWGTRSAGSANTPSPRAQWRTARLGLGLFSDARWLGATLAVLGIGWAATASQQWQDGLRHAMGLPETGTTHWLGTGIVAAATFGVCCGGGRLVRRAGVLRSAAATLAAVVLLGPAVVQWRAATYRTADAAMDTTVVQPVSLSIPEWSALGAHGRRFVGGAERGLRVYAGLGSAPSHAARAAVAVGELEARGGLQRSAVVVAIPTGSGWIDESAAVGIERRFDGDVAIVGMQYSYAPSWATFLLGRAAASAAAHALLDAVSQRLQQLSQPPRLYVYGQSLGALAAATSVPPTACASLWAGPPAGTAVGSATVLANSSDPVVWWSPELLWRRPDLTRAQVDAPVPRWLPGLTFLQTTVDLFGAQRAPTGHGHHYGANQGNFPTACD